jgi:hypothetical protein
MTFLVVFFTIVWFIRFVKQHFKSWEHMVPLASNSLSTGEQSSCPRCQLSFSGQVDRWTGGGLWFTGRD